MSLSKLLCTNLLLYIRTYSAHMTLDEIPHIPRVKWACRLLKKMDVVEEKNCGVHALDTSHCFYVE